MKNNRIVLISIIFIFLPLIVTLITLNYLPTSITIHFNGTINKLNNKFEILTLPILGIIFSLLILFVSLHALKKPEYINNKKMITVTNTIVIFLFNILTYNYLYLIISKTYTTNSISNKLPLIMIGIIILLLGNYTPKTTRNSLFGIKTKATKSDDEIWNKTQRTGGYILTIFGVFFIIITITTTNSIALPILIIMLIVITIYLYIYSNNLYKKKYK